ncbi:hypothetical protein JTE90_025438 [Oedothorax gibbosus]|uniref:THAP-type domain-containing protein n=1 Tax=Oedothorax gibbosus TaxID=931172 RepID=A0AAV6U943_9ARAC|nr:hypothetical protein JTE90_025438 [Oedothorax gibbosus]
MPKFCCVPFCKRNNRVHSNLSFHEFPSKLDLRNEWIKVIPIKDFVPRDHSAICSRHFQVSDFIHYKTKKALKRGTVPSVFIDQPSHKRPQGKYLCRILKRGNEDNENCAGEKSKEMSPSKLEQANLLMDFHNTSLDLHSETTVTTIIPKRDIENKNTQENKLTQTKVTFDALNKNQIEVKRLQRLLAARNKRIDSLQSNLNEAKEKLSYFETDTHFKNLGKMKAQLDAGVATKQVEFVLNQVNNFDKTKPRWPDNILRECVLFHASSPAGYRHIQQKEILDLPCTRTLQRFLGPANGAVEFTFSIKEDLTEEVNELESTEEWESLIANEIDTAQQDMNIEQFIDSISETSNI